MPRYCLLLLLVLVSSCSVGEQYWLSDEELERFEKAGPIEPELDTDRILSGIPNPGPYEVVTGDLLGFQGPKTIFAEEDPAEGLRMRLQRRHLARVDSNGDVVLPVIGKLPVRGSSLLEIEAMIAKAAYPKFVQTQPSIVCQVIDYQTTKVSVVGSVEKPGMVQLRSDTMSLFGALTAAGGIQRTMSDYVAGAKMIRIRRPGESSAKAMILPVKGLNVPVGDVALKGGETIEVERWKPETYTVIGLVKKPGAYPYSPDTNYNLMQALATAGGVDMTANPPFATVFRKDRNGQVLPATFEIDGPGLAQSSTLGIKPGDVIVVQHTAASWTRSLLAEVLRIQLGFFLDRSSVD